MDSQRRCTPVDYPGASYARIPPLSDILLRDHHARCPKYTPGRGSWLPGPLRLVGGKGGSTAFDSLVGRIAGFGSAGIGLHNQLPRRLWRAFCLCVCDVRDTRPRWQLFREEPFWWRYGGQAEGWYVLIILVL